MTFRQHSIGLKALNVTDTPVLADWNLGHDEFRNFGKKSLAELEQLSKKKTDFWNGLFCKVINLDEDN